MPLLEMMAKDLLFQYKQTLRYFKNKGQHKTLVCYPHFPSRGATIFKICNYLNYNITNRIDSPCQSYLYYEYLTYREEFQLLEAKRKSQKVINLFSRNIGKVFVDEIHQSTFGYQTQIDPLHFSGKAVKKNVINAKHDGHIIQCPVAEKEEGFIYQKLLNNEVEDGTVLDIRVPVIGKQIPFLYFKYRKNEERFLNTETQSLIKEVADVFSENEINLILKFCESLQLEFGELDIIRDKNDGRIYVIDVNNTPQGPPGSISEEEGRRAIERLALCFEREFLI